MISPQVFIDFFRHGSDEVKIVKNALPEDATYVRSFVDDITGHGRIGLVIESYLFDEIKEGDLIPILPDPLFEKVYT